MITHSLLHHLTDPCWLMGRDRQVMHDTWLKMIKLIFVAINITKCQNCLKNTDVSGV